MKIIVSACLLGENCKYNGGNNLCPRVVEYVKDQEVILKMIIFVLELKSLD